MRSIFLVTLMVLLPLHVWAGDDYSQPARGTETRAALMDVIRPIAAWNLGAPVEFVVDDLRVSGDLGFAILYPQRPGGGKIDIRQTPMMQRGGVDPDFYDGVRMEILYQKSGATWVAVHWAIGATDVWWSDPELCAVFHAVTPEVCR